MNHPFDDEPSSRELVAQYIVDEFLGRGFFLPYADYEIIEEWLKEIKDPEILLLVLSEILPKYFDRDKKKPPRSIKGVRKRVLKRIQEYSPSF